jgi:hypothetical protein
MNHKLTIRFAGICTHFRHGAAAGVPHRVVLADASRFLSDLVTVAESPTAEPILYYLMPHFAQLEVVGVVGERDPLNVPPFEPGGSMAVKNGDVATGIRLQVVNAVDREMTYADEDTPKLVSYVHRYTLSTDVVLQGRAAVYFDLYGGKIYSRLNKGGARQTYVDLTTDGPPELLVTPLAASTSPITAARLLLGDEPVVTLNVKNLEEADREVKLDHQGGAFDFLLHYLTATGGIPQSFKSLTPGMLPHNLVSATREDLARALAGMSDILRNPARRKLVHPDEVTPSCSDSQYP